MPGRRYCVYIMANHSRRLYVGCTSDLVRRLFEHRQGFGPEHTRRYRISKLVWWDTVRSKREALENERRIKGRRRSKKVALIEETNLGWHDLSHTWIDQHQG